MNAPERFFLPDVQSIRDGRRVAIDRVGVKGMLHPVRVRACDGAVQRNHSAYARVERDKERDA